MLARFGHTLRYDHHPTRNEDPARITAFTISARLSVLPFRHTYCSCGPTGFTCAALPFLLILPFYRAYRFYNFTRLTDFSDLPASPFPKLSRPVGIVGRNSGGYIIRKLIFPVGIPQLADGIHSIGDPLMRVRLPNELEDN